MIKFIEILKSIFSGECKTQWHVRPGGDFKDEEEVSKHQGHNLLVNAASRVWEVIMTSKNIKTLKLDKKIPKNWKQHIQLE